MVCDADDARVVLTGRISKVCRAPVFRVMVSLSLAGAEESDADRETESAVRVNDASNVKLGQKTRTAATISPTIKSFQSFFKQKCLKCFIIHAVNDESLFWTVGWTNDAT